MENTKKIVSLTAENIKRLKAVRIEPDGNIVQITGRNAQGKSSVLDAIEMALGGKDHTCNRPVRDGEQKAKVECDLGDLIVTRTFTPGGGGTLSVRSKDGAKYPSPQSILDSLVGKLTFDPLAFSRLPARQQAETLRSIIGIDFATMDSRRACLFDERTLVNRDLSSAKARLANCPEVAAPDSPVDVSALLIRANEIAVANAAVDRAEAERGGAALRVEIATKSASELERQLAAKREEIRAMMVELSAKTKRLDGMARIDPAETQKAIAESQCINRLVEENQSRVRLLADVASTGSKAEELTDAIDRIDQEKRKALELARFPVEGLGFDAGGVTYGGVPLAQASGAERLRVSAAICLAQNPKLRVMLIRDGSLLDAGNMRMLAEMAEQNDAQIWIERVSDGDPVGVVIEDGEIA